MGSDVAEISQLAIQFPIEDIPEKLFHACQLHESTVT